MRTARIAVDLYPSTAGYASKKNKSALQFRATQSDSVIDEDLRKKTTKEEVDVMQTQLSPAHPDFGKLGFAELEDRIRERAYQLYEKRGYVHGYALADWLEAKAQVLGLTSGRTYLENVPPSAKHVSGGQ